MEGPLIAYTIVLRERDGRKFWIRIGSATKDRDGQVNVVLDAIPTNGTLVIRPARTSDPEGGNVLDRGETR
jgi:hypothetical protein